jgi:exonuclease SbcC
VSYKIESLKVRNFKCFNEKKFYEFCFKQDTNPVILSGPNGFGKTTFFDATELIFTNNITRLNSEIEDGRTNLGKNILLNTSSECGYLVLTLIDDSKNRVTIIAEIDNGLTKLTINTALRFTYIEGTIDINTFDEFIRSGLTWKKAISEFEYLNYIKEHFNIYYYVSQAESLHFLKNSISNRKDSLTKLLQTDIVDSKIDYLDNNLIGGSSKKKDVLINDEIKSTKIELGKKLEELKIKIKNTNDGCKEVAYKKLLEYPDKIDIKNWDAETHLDERLTDKQFEAFIDEVNALHYLYNDMDDYKTWKKNNEILKLSKNDVAIENYIKYYDFIVDDKLDVKKIEDRIAELNYKLDVFKYSDFFRKELDISKFKIDDLVKLQELKIIPADTDIKDLHKQVEEIKILNNKIGKNSRTINEIIEARERLHILGKNNPNSLHWPYCNSPFDNIDLLESAYNSLSTQLKNSQGILATRLAKMKNNFSNDVNLIAKSISKVLGQNYDDEIENVRISSSNYSMFLKSDKSMMDVVKIHRNLGEVDSWVTLDETSKIIEIKRIIEDKVTDYKNKEYSVNNEKYNYDEFYKKNAKLLSVDQPKLKDYEQVKNKIDYLIFKYNLSKNTDINQCKKEIKKLIIKKKKLEKIRNNFDALKDTYKAEINEYKNLVLNKLRVPLLIYTGKILQDYQNGLGVFINEDEMRFVSNGDAKHDILNTFSSGQLSGFVLSFLFAMNKRYITEASDDIGFILIDDPVQTMDDINIASFIEVLRNDFPDKQIILSTHESDKENYILYKFLKYNLKGQSFNVKDKMY